MSARRRGSSGWMDRQRSAGPAPGITIQRIEAAGVGPAAGAMGRSAVLGGLDPGRLAPGSRATTLAEMGALAGNRAVAELVGETRADFPLDPPEGVREIRRVGGGGTLGHCRRALEVSPPLFRIPSPAQVEGGYAARPSRTRAPEPDFEVRYPTPGRHVMYEGRNDEGAEANTYLDVSTAWSARLLVGEEEHVEDQTIAWEGTWKRVADTTNQLADGAPIVAATPEAATRAAWDRFVAALPPLLRPAGQDPTEAAQLAKWGYEPADTPFRKLMGESKRARDDSHWHWPDATLKGTEGTHEIREIVPGGSRIPGVRPTELMRAAWTRLEAEAGGSGGQPGRGGGVRRR